MSCSCFVLCILYLSQTTGFTFPFQQTEDVTLTDRSFDVADNGPTGAILAFVVQKFHANLCYVTRVAGPTQHLVDLAQFDRLIL
jgi:hypothetical protein